VLICGALTDGLTPKERASLLDFLSSPMPLINHRGSIASKAASTSDIAVPTRETAVWACMSSVVWLGTITFGREREASVCIKRHPAFVLTHEQARENRALYPLLTFPFDTYQVPIMSFG